MADMIVRCVGMICLTVIALAIIGSINIKNKRKDGTKHD